MLNFYFCSVLHIKPGYLMMYLMLVLYTSGIIQKFVLRSELVKFSILQSCYTIFTLFSHYFPSVLILHGLYSYKMLTFLVHYYTPKIYLAYALIFSLFTKVFLANSFTCVVYQKFLLPKFSHVWYF